MPQMKNRCKDCLFLRQEWKLDWTRVEQDFKFFVNLDTYCGICDIFKSPEGYCDLWEGK